MSCKVFLPSSSTAHDLAALVPKGQSFLEASRRLPQGRSTTNSYSMVYLAKALRASTASCAPGATDTTLRSPGSSVGKIHVRSCPSWHAHYETKMRPVVTLACSLQPVRGRSEVLQVHPTLAPTLPLRPLSTLCAISPSRNSSSALFAVVSLDVPLLFVACGSD